MKQQMTASRINVHNNLFFFVIIHKSLFKSHSMCCGRHSHLKPSVVSFVLKTLYMVEHSCIKH